MSALLVAVVMLAAGAGLVWLLLRGREYERQRDFERKVHARRQGWQYDGARDGRIEYRFSGTANGVAWQMEYDSDRGAESPTPRATWHSDNLRTPQLSVVILGRSRYALESGVAGRLMLGVLSGVAQAVAGRDANPISDKSVFYDSATLLEPARRAPAAPFAVAVAPEIPRDWLDDELLRLLAAWPDAGSARFKPPNCVEATLGPGGLRITVQHMPQDMPCWLHLAQLGEQLAHRLAARASQR
jgi:hypothetical protein